MAKLSLHFECEGSDKFISTEYARFMREQSADHAAAGGVKRVEDAPTAIRSQVPRYMGWGDILPMIKAGSPRLFVGDVVECTLTDGRHVDFVVTDDSGNALRFESRDCLGDYVCRDKIDQYFDKVYAAMPQALQDAIIDTERPYFDVDGNRQVEMRKLFLPAASEVFPPDDCYGDKGLYEQMSWYRDFRNRIRGKSKGSEYPDWYWLSSRRSGGSTSWCYVSYDGFANYGAASNTYVGAPVCFRILKS